MNSVHRRQIVSVGLLLGLGTTLAFSSGVVALKEARFEHSRRLLALSDLLNTGDLVYRQGTSLESAAVLASQQNFRYSHVGLAVRLPMRGLRVLHSVPPDKRQRGGVLLDTLDNYLGFAESPHFLVERLNLLTASRRERLVSELSAFIGRPFDTSYSMDSGDSVYCSELVIRVFRAIGIELPANHWEADTPFGRIKAIRPADISTAARELGATVLAQG